LVNILNEKNNWFVLLIVKILFGPEGGGEEGAGGAGAQADQGVHQGHHEEAQEQQAEECLSLQADHVEERIRH